MSDAKEFIQLLNENQNIIHKVCTLYMDNITEREDLFQEITLQAWHSFKNFRNESKFSTWLYRVALNTAISYFRREKNKPSFHLTNQIPDAPEQKESDQERMNAMYKAIASLNKIDKALIMLYLEDYNYEEIGSVLCITANNVAVKVNRIKIKLRELTKKHYELS